jgi:hypothetical protein
MLKEPVSAKNTIDGQKQGDDLFPPTLCSNDYEHLKAFYEDDILPFDLKSHNILLPSP